jgi:hypothetical protein
MFIPPIVHASCIAPRWNIERVTRLHVLILFCRANDIASPPPGTGPLKIVKSSTGKSMLCSPNRTACLASLGVTVLAGSPSDVGKLVADETEKMAKVIRANNIKAE